MKYIIYLIIIIILDEILKIAAFTMDILMFVVGTNKNLSGKLRHFFLII